METLHVGTHRVRYQRPASAGGVVERRMDALLRLMREDVLARAIERAGVAPHEEVCVRRLHLSVRLDLRASDIELAARWSQRLAEELAQAIREGAAGQRDDVVCFGSRAHALADCVNGVARGDLRRAWAWRRVGGSVRAFMGMAPLAEEARILGTLPHECQYPLVTLP